VTPQAGLDARLFIGTEEVITGPEELAFPNTRVQIQHHGGFLGKL
jgi:hypothetical protein